LRLHHTPSECPALTLGAKVYIDPDFSRNDAVIMYSMARGRDFSNHPLWAALGDAILASDLSLEDYQEQFGYRRLREACIANAKYNALGDSRGIGNEDLDRPLRVFELISSPKGLLRETLSSAPDSQVEMRVMIACGGLQFGSTLEGLLRELEIHRNNRRFDLANIAVLDVLVHKDMMKSCFDRMPGQELSPEAISCKLFFGGLVDLGMKGHEEFVRGLRITDEKSFDATFEKLKALLSLELRPLAELEHQV
ncbi:MAG: hypothetical protein KDD64_15540, partial [Bdellovibrionales bacterium]|nr:hypothetical protein [Bdellovibrionales bacterium]